MIDRAGRLIRARRRHGAALLLLAAGALPAACLSRPVRPAPPPEPAAVPAPHRLTAWRGWRFEPREEGGSARREFLGRGPGALLRLTGGEAVLRPSEAPAGAAVAWRLELRGADPGAAGEGVERLPGVSHYFLSNDPGRWRTNVRQYGRVRFRDVYPGIDAVYYGRDGELQYDFVVHPGADPGLIRLAFTTGQGGVAPIAAALSPDGDLLLSAAGGELRHRRPLLYQEIGGQRREIAGGFVLHAAGAGTGDAVEVGFAAAAYDRKRPLVIDPVVLYSTYLGGSGGDGARGIAVDREGSAYLLGETGSADFPTRELPGESPGAAFIAKLTPRGDALAYTVFLGGSHGASPISIAVDDAGCAYVSGYTSSADFPVTPGAFQPELAARGGASDAFIAKLGPDGSALRFSTYLGGSAQDEGTGLAVDAEDNVIITGRTASPDFPVVDALQPVLSGGTGPAGAHDAFVAKLDASGAFLHYATYLGAPGGATLGLDLALGAGGGAYIVGSTTAADFPTTPEGFQPIIGGASDGFVAQLSPTGDRLLDATFFGGSGDDSIAAVAVDAAGQAHVVGTTTSLDLPTRNAVQPIHAGARDAFVAKLDPERRHLIYATYLGGSANRLSTIEEAGRGIALDSAGNAYVVGGTISSDFPILNALDPFNEVSDAFVTALGPSGALRFSTYFGGSEENGATALAVDGAGDIYVAGSVFDPPRFGRENFPLAAALQPLNGAGGSDAFVAKLTTRTATQLCAYVLLDPVRAPFVSEQAGSVAIIEATRRAMLGELPVAFSGSLLADVAVGAGGGQAYIANLGIVLFPAAGGAGGQPPLQSFVAVVDTAEHMVTDRIELPDRVAPALLALAPGGDRLFVGGPGGHLLALDTETHAVVGRVGGLPDGRALVMAPGGNRLYLTTGGANRVDVIDPATVSVAGSVPFPPGSQVEGAALSADGSRLYVAAMRRQAVGVVDTATLSVTDLVPVSMAPVRVVVSPDGATVYAAGRQRERSGFGALAILDAEPPRLRATLPFERPVADVAVTPDGAFVYLTNAEANTVTVLETRTHQLVSIIEVPGAAGRIALAEMPNGCSTPPVCGGDCNGDRQVTIDEVLRIVQIVLGQLAPQLCIAVDANDDGVIGIGDAVQAVRLALEGCPQG